MQLEVFVLKYIAFVNIGSGIFLVIRKFLMKRNRLAHFKNMPADFFSLVATFSSSEILEQSLYSE